MIRLADRARRAEAAQAHRTGDLMDQRASRSRQGGKRRIVPISDRGRSSRHRTFCLFPNGTGHLTAEHVGENSSQALPGDATLFAAPIRHPPTAAPTTCGCLKRLLSASIVTTERLQRFVRRRVRAAALNRMVSRPGVCCSRSASPTGGSYSPAAARRGCTAARMGAHPNATIADVVEHGPSQKAASKTRFAGFARLGLHCLLGASGSPSWNDRRAANSSGNAKAASRQRRNSRRVAGSSAELAKIKRDAHKTDTAISSEALGTSAATTSGSGGRNGSTTA